MDFKTIHIDETDSTNRWLRETTLPERAGNLVVVSDFQTAGKGCGTNSWESERGKNLTFSMLIHPTELPANHQFHITEIVSVALCRTLADYLSDKVEIKWPNDIYVGDKKICGILIENRLQGNVIMDSIIGIGLNVNQTVFRSDAPNPVSLSQLTGKETDRDKLLADFLHHFAAAYKSESIGTVYRDLLYRKDMPSRYLEKTSACTADVETTASTIDSAAFTATLIDVEPDGRLVLKDEQGKLRRYFFKEVQFVL